MTTGPFYCLMKPHKPPISCLACRRQGRASQRSAMTLPRCGLMGGIVIVRTTTSRARRHTAPPSHMCLALSLELMLATVEGDCLAKTLAAPMSPFRVLFSTSQRSLGRFKLPVRSRGPSSSWTLVRLCLKKVLRAPLAKRECARRGQASAGSATKRSAPRLI